MATQVKDIATQVQDGGVNTAETTSAAQNAVTSVPSTVDEPKTTNPVKKPVKRRIKRIIPKEADAAATKTSEAAAEGTPKAATAAAPKKVAATKPPAKTASPKSGANTTAEKPGVKSPSATTAVSKTTASSPTPVPASRSRRPHPFSWLTRRFGAAAMQDLIDNDDNDDDNDDDDDDGASDDDHDDDDDDHDDKSDDDNDDHDDRDSHQRESHDFEKDEIRHQDSHNGGAMDKEILGAVARQVPAAAGRQPPQQFTKSNLSKPVTKSSPSPPTPSAAEQGAEKKRTVEINEKEIKNDNSSDKDSKSSSSLNDQALNIFEWVVKFINILFPLFFIALGVLHIIRNGRASRDPNDTFSMMVSSINSAAITLWGIMFAAIAGQALKAYATFQAERGIKLISLEQLLHSQSFSSAIKQPLLLRRIDITGITLFFLWALSPLTNQALQKMSIETPSDVPQDYKIRYLNTTFPSTNTKSWPFTSNYSEASTTVFKFALLSNKVVRASQQDIWNHLKIPLLTNLTTYQSPNQSFDWIPYNNNNNGVKWNYSSELGIPLQDMPVNGQTNLTIPSSYWLFDCEQPTTKTYADLNNNNDGFIFDNYSMSVSQTLMMAYAPISNDSETYDPSSNMTFSSTGARIAWASVKNYTSLDALCTPEDKANGECAYKRQPTASTEYVYGACSMRAIGVESAISCTGIGNEGNCTVTRARVIPSANATANYSSLPISEYMVSLFASSAEGDNTTLAEQYLADPGVALSGLEHSTYNSSNISSLTAGEFSTRMTMLWNSWYAVLYAQSSYVEGFDDDAPTSNAAGAFLSYATIWRIQAAWLAVYFFAVAVVLGLAVADVVWEFRTVSPDFLGFASSVVRSNTHLSRELKGLSGPERTRRMADMNVMLQDVGRGGAANSANSEKRASAAGATAAVAAAPGKIALAPKTAGSERLRKGGVYRS